MQNIKNFKVVSPSGDQIKKFSNDSGLTPLFLISEDGKDWYECQSLFSDDTIKIMYDENGIICSVVDEPIPERGNIYAVSMFYPENMSVAEVPLSDYPEGVKIDGSWMFQDGVITQVPIDAFEQATQRIGEAEKVIAPLQRAVKYGIATDEEKQQLEEWEVYTVLLNRIAASQSSAIEWPEKPGMDTKNTK
ncbi:MULTISPECIES: tail fiber assembly protein [unclassified Enterobacter]|uniref:tail fiber assembly protein n=1 Tax=unclassified Enterobacter TaxID=2608935 RepID=UPI001CC1483F|nr:MULTISPECIES: tail fiber assembly protein [unclassified Enterobacter]UAN42641.1 tail fiber assembly protein [Enterobacter sp. JBIWA008]UXP22347.1 tail fiber assembly protein [Enterobacter sp. 155105]